MHVLVVGFEVPLPVLHGLAMFRHHGFVLDGDPNGGRGRLPHLSIGHGLPVDVPRRSAGKQIEVEAEDQVPRCCLRANHRTPRQQVSHDAATQGYPSDRRWRTKLSIPASMRLFDRAQPQLLGLQPHPGDLEVALAHLDADTVSPPGSGRQVRGPRAGEGIQHRVTDEGEHPDETFGQVRWKWRRVVPRGGAGHGPYLLVPLLVTILRNH